jgi:ABC-2 type transport system permease protein
MFARSFDDTSIVTTFILTPLSYLGGIFFSIDVLPDFWGKIALFNPILYLVDSFRYAVTGITDINPYLSIAIISILCLVMFTINSILLQRGKGIRN